MTGCVGEEKKKVILKNQMVLRASDELEAAYLILFVYNEKKANKSLKKLDGQCDCHVVIVQ